MNDHKFPFENIDFNDLKWSEMMAIWRASLMFKPRSLGFVSWRWGYIDHTYSTGDFVRISPIKSEMAPFYGYGQVMALTNRPTNGQLYAPNNCKLNGKYDAPKHGQILLDKPIGVGFQITWGCTLLKTLPLYRHAQKSRKAEKQASREKRRSKEGGKSRKAEKQRSWKPEIHGKKKEKKLTKKIAYKYWYRYRFRFRYTEIRDR